MKNIWLCQSIIRGDTLYIMSLDRLSRNKADIKAELQWFKDNGIRLMILDLPSSMIQVPEGQEWIIEMINNILIEVLSSMAECLVGAGILLAFIGIKIAGLYKKYCWDMITILVTLISMAIAICFGDWIKTALSINMLLLLLFVQMVYVAIRWYCKGMAGNKGILLVIVFA